MMTRLGQQEIPPEGDQKKGEAKILRKKRTNREEEKRYRVPKQTRGG